MSGSATRPLLRLRLRPATALPADAGGRGPGRGLGQPLLGNGLLGKGLLAACLLACCLLAAAPAAWASAQDHLTLVHPGDDQPYCFRDDNGQSAGLLVDYWRLWGSKAGVEVRLVLAQGGEALPQVVSGKADALAGLPFTPALENTLAFTRPLLDLGIGVFAQSGEDGLARQQLETESASVGLVQDDPSAAFLAATYPNLRQEYFPNLAVLAAAASQGQVRVVAGPVLGLRYQLASQPKGPRFELLRAFPGVQLRAAVPRGDAALLERLNVGMAAISQAEVRQLEDKWSGPAWHMPGWGLALGGCLALLAVALWMFLRVRGVRSWAEVRIREADLLRNNLLAEMTRHRKTQDLLLAAIEQSPSGIVIAFADNIPAIRNRQAVRIFGPGDVPPQGSSPGVHPWRVFTPNGVLVSEADLPLNRALRHGETMENVELRLEPDDGESRW
ncbi:MAG: transporter substrate-binding domain-containing protein, partial [Humidesulfovibrio sp.]|nr:transporter substrate-binding domain-containing protein [Humidesulfovibrio sp.]